MKLFSVYWIFVIFLCEKWVLDVAIDSLQTKCQTDRTPSLVVVLLYYIGAVELPEPPWWEPLCGVTEGQTRDYLYAASVLLTFLPLTMAPGPKVNRKKRKNKRLRHRRLPPPAINRQSPRSNTPDQNHVRPRSIPMVTPPVHTPPNDSNNNTTLMSYIPRLDGHIFIEHVPPKPEATYRGILIGPVTRAFQGVRLLLVAMFKALLVPESALRWTTRCDPAGTPVFLGASTATLRAEAVLVPDQGIDILVQRLGPPQGLIREVPPKPEATHRGILIGPVARAFQGVRLFLVAMFKALLVPESALRWTTRCDPAGTPVFLGASTATLRAEAVLVPDQGIDILVQRLGPPRGLRREVTYQSYQLTYKGVICTDTGTTLLYGSSWD